MNTVEITLTKGLVGKPGTQRRVVKALGLTKYGSSVKHAKTATIMGMVNKVQHLVTVSESNKDHKSTASEKSPGKKLVKQSAI